MGFEVDAINTVQFSNHTGYPTVKGTVLQGDELCDIFGGLAVNELTTYSHVLTGYIGSLTVMEAIVGVVKRLKELNPGLSYVCDPVMGDNGRMYVPDGCLKAFRDNILPLASVVTPNQFEAELLTGRAVNREEDAVAACNDLHAMGTSTVVITSVCPTEGDADHITVIGSTKEPQIDGSPSEVRLQTKKIPGYFTGVGDLLTALLLAKLHCSPEKFGQAIEESVAALQGVMKITAEEGGSLLMSTDRTAEVFRARELRLIQGQDFLINPTIEYRAEPFKCVRK